MLTPASLVYLDLILHAGDQYVHVKTISSSEKEKIEVCC